MRGEGLLKLLLLKGSNYTGVGGGTGVPGRTREEVLCALSGAGVTGFKYNFLEAYINGTGDEGDVDRLAIQAYIWAAGISADKGWSMTNGKEILRPCVVDAMKEILCRGFMRCEGCNGAGTNRKGNICRSCSNVEEELETKVKRGNGIRKRKRQAYCNALGIERTAWNKTWSEHHDTLKKELLSIVTVAADNLQNVVDGRRNLSLERTVKNISTENNYSNHFTTRSKCPIVPLRMGNNAYIKPKRKKLNDHLPILSLKTN